MTICLSQCAKRPLCLACGCATEPNRTNKTTGLWYSHHRRDEAHTRDPGRSVGRSAGWPTSPVKFVFTKPTSNFSACSRTFLFVNTRNRCVHGQMSKNGQHLPVFRRFWWCDFLFSYSRTPPETHFFRCVHEQRGNFVLSTELWWRRFAHWSVCSSATSSDQSCGFSRRTTEVVLRTEASGGVFGILARMPRACAYASGADKPTQHFLVWRPNLPPFV